MSTNVIVTTGNRVEGIAVREYLGPVQGVAVRVPTIGQGLQAIGKALGGNFQAGAEVYAEAYETARAQAYELMVERARELEADAIIAVRYNSTVVGESATGVLAYGTAIKLKFPEVTPVPP